MRIDKTAEEYFGEQGHGWREVAKDAGADVDDADRCFRYFDAGFVRPTDYATEIADRLVAHAGELAAEDGDELDLSDVEDFVADAAEAYHSSRYPWWDRGEGE